MKGPYPLNRVRDYVRQGSIGVYVLGIENDNTRYVGRSDRDLQREIPYRARRREYWRRIRYDHFFFEEVGSAFEAYKLECTLWHKYGGEEGMLDQCRHPATPKYSGWYCPIPGCPHHRRRVTT
jgi:hypothetical protein